MSEQVWMERAQTAEAQLATCSDNIDRVKDKHRNMMEALGARERSDGKIDIDFVALAEKLSLEDALVLRAAIDEKHRITGAPGEKPRVAVASGSGAQ